MGKQPNKEQTVAEAERVIAELERKRQALAERQGELNATRSNLSYSAHAGLDAAAGRELAVSRAQALDAEQQLIEIDAALATAQRRLQQARQAEAREADKAQARELRKAVERFVAIGRDLDRTFAHLADQGAALQAALAEVHRCGSPFPSAQQLDVLGMICVRSALQNSPWQRAVERTAPHERRSFRQLVEGWAAGIEQNAVKPRLGEHTDTEAA